MILLEDDPGWYRTARAALPPAYAEMVELHNPRKVDGHYRIFRCVCYDLVPERSYEFVFSDGPDRHSPVDAQKLFNLDLIKVVARTERPLRAIVDNHYLTFYVLQKVSRMDKARYDAWRKMLHVGPVSRVDLGYLHRESFLSDLRVSGATELRLRLGHARVPDTGERGDGQILSTWSRVAVPAGNRDRPGILNGVLRWILVATALYRNDPAAGAEAPCHGMTVAGFKVRIQTRARALSATRRGSTRNDLQAQARAVPS